MCMKSPESSAIGGGARRDQPTRMTIAIRRGRCDRQGMLPPVETTPRISREATRPTTLTALALALFAAQPALAQDAADMALQ